MYRWHFAFTQSILKKSYHTFDIRSAYLLSKHLGIRSFKLRIWCVVIFLAKLSGNPTRKKMPNLGSNSLSSFTGSYPLTIWLLGSGKIPNNLMVRGYEPGREGRKFNPRLGNFFLVRWKKTWRINNWLPYQIMLRSCITCRCSELVSAHLQYMLATLSIKFHFIHHFSAEQYIVQVVKINRLISKFA